MLSLAAACDGDNGAEDGDDGRLLPEIAVPHKPKGNWGLKSGILVFPIRDKHNKYFR